MTGHTQPEGSTEAANALRRETAAGNPHAVQSRAVEERSLFACAPSFHTFASSDASGSLRRAVSPLAAVPDPPAVPPPGLLDDPADRGAALEGERTRLLSRAVADHLPHELVLRVAAIERELAGLGRGVG